MQHGHRRSSGLLLRLAAFSLAGGALYALGRSGRTPESGSVAAEIELAPPTKAETPTPIAVCEPSGALRRRRRRLAVAFCLTVCFVGGAALSAGAGDQVAPLLEETEGAPTTVVTPEPAAPAPVEPEPAEAVASAPVPEADAESAEPAPLRSGTATPKPVAAPAATTPEPPAPAEVKAKAKSNPRARPPGVKRPRASWSSKSSPHASWSSRRGPNSRSAPKPREASQPTAGYMPPAGAVWLRRTIDVPTPEAVKLSTGFARLLRAESRLAGADWTVVLAVLRIRGELGPDPVGLQTLRSTAHELQGVRVTPIVAQSHLLGWVEAPATLPVAGSEELAHQAAALARYHRAVGMDALVEGLGEVQEQLAERVLADDRIDIYWAGREDIGAGRIDPRVLALVSYLAETWGQVTLSSLVTGHRIFSRPGVVSQHVFGEAVDVAALSGVPILGHQEPGGLTEHAVLSILRLPEDLQPLQVISLLGLGGPSFPLADHHDHIHVGF